VENPGTWAPLVVQMALAIILLNLKTRYARTRKVIGSHVEILPSTYPGSSVGRWGRIPAADWPVLVEPTGISWKLIVCSRDQFARFAQFRGGLGVARVLRMLLFVRAE
jgi:hypothetical protein